MISFGQSVLDFVYFCDFVKFGEKRWKKDPKMLRTYLLILTDTSKPSGANNNTQGATNCQHDGVCLAMKTVTPENIDPCSQFGGRESLVIYS